MIMRKCTILKSQKMTATNREQSQRLLACGVDPETADMVWTIWDNDGERYEQLSIMDESAYEMACLNPIPAWSLGALLTKVLPNVFEDGNYRHVLTIQYVHGATEDRVWDMRYEDILTGMFIHDIDAPHPIEACVRMVEKLKEKGRI